MKIIVDGIIGGLILGWILSLFGFDNIIITSLKEMFNIALSLDNYFLIFAVIGGAEEYLRNNSVPTHIRPE